MLFLSPMIAKFLMQDDTNQYSQTTDLYNGIKLKQWSSSEESYEKGKGY